MKYKDRCYKPEELKKTQEVLVEVLKDLLRVCEENNIPIAMEGGTAIGTVRHKGFIPWDDDIDVLLLRKDYDRLLKIMPQALGERFGTDNWLENPDFPAPNACVYARGTVSVPVEMKNCKYRYGVSLGVYPYDNIYDDDKKAKKQLRKCWFFGRLHWLKVLPFPYIPYKGIKRTLIYTACFIAHVLLKLVPKKWIVKKCEQYARECENMDTKRAAIALAGNPFSTIIEKDKIFPLVDGEFEGIKVKLVNCYDEYLRREYSGDYMQLPPEDKRKNHFPCELDFGDF